MNKPLISIVIPVYNTEKYLEKCLESVINQTYKNLQIILVDDGSVDRSADICDAYALKDDRIEVIHQENKGNSSARNAGIARIRGDYVGFVDSDDWIHPGMYEHLLDILLRYNADISTIETVKVTSEIDEENVRQEKVCIQTLSQEEYARIFFKMGTQKIAYYVYDKLYKREIVQNECFDNRFLIGEDVIVSYKFLMEARKIVISNQIMYYYRQMSGITSKWNEKQLKLVEVWDEVGKITKQYNAEKYQYYVEVNQARINFTILTELAVRGEYRNPKYSDCIKKLLIELKRNKKMLLRSDIVINRKIMILAACLNYKLYAWTVCRIKHKA